MEQPPAEVELPASKVNEIEFSESAVFGGILVVFVVVFIALYGEPVSADGRHVAHTYLEIVTTAGGLLGALFAIYAYMGILRQIKLANRQIDLANEEIRVVKEDFRLTNQQFEDLNRKPKMYLTFSSHRHHVKFTYEPNQTFAAAVFFDNDGDRPNSEGVVYFWVEPYLTDEGMVADLNGSPMQKIERVMTKTYPKSGEGNPVVIYFKNLIVGEHIIWWQAYDDYGRYPIYAEYGMLKFTIEA